MKRIVLIALLLFACPHIYAQRFDNGDNVLSVGLGLGSSLGGRHYSSTPGISLQYEHGNWDAGGPGVISLGAYLGFQGFTYSAFGYHQKLNYTIIGIRSSYHYNGIHSEDVDVYGGLMLSYNIASYSNDFPSSYGYANDYGSGVGLTLYIGGRYYFTDNVAAFLELGYGISFATIVASFKL